MPTVDAHAHRASGGPARRTAQRPPTLGAARPSGPASHALSAALSDISSPPSRSEPSSGSTFTRLACVRRAQASGLGCRDWFTPQVYTSSPDVIGSQLSAPGVLRPAGPQLP
eukprot:1112294-Prorocentrum_minimum.AAC.1